MKPRHIIHSVGYDSTISPGADKYDKPGIIAELNTALINKIAENKSAKSNTLINGSTRQSIHFDEYENSRSRNGSCFMALKDLNEGINKQISCSLDTYLLADTFHKDREGTNFEAALQRYTLKETLPKRTYVPIHFSETIHDVSKILMIYLQSHRSAKLHYDENNNPDIIFNFYEGDRGTILPLAQFFEKHPALLASNITLNIYHYCNYKTPQLFSVIQGLGDIDFDYAENAMIISTFNKKKGSPRLYKFIDLSDLEVNEFLKNRKQTQSNSIYCSFWRNPYYYENNDDSPSFIIHQENGCKMINN